MKRWVIFGAADISDYSPISRRLNDDDYIVCADGGSKHLSPLGIEADLYIGDYDSSNKPDTDKELMIYPVEKDYTDTLLAIQTGLKRGCRNFLIFGGTGGRADHTYSNIQSLLYAERHGASAALADEKNFMFFLKNDTAYIEKNEGEKVSIFSYDPAASGVTLEGFYYPLVNGTIYSHLPIGVSNYIVADKGKITVKKGTLLIIISKEG